MVLLEFDRGQVVQALVRTHGVVMPAPRLDENAASWAGARRRSCPVARRWDRARHGATRRNRCMRYRHTSRRAPSPCSGSVSWQALVPCC